jgi:hypothetical protein
MEQSHSFYITRNTIKTHNAIHWTALFPRDHVRGVFLCPSTLLCLCSRDFEYLWTMMLHIEGLLILHKALLDLAALLCPQVCASILIDSTINYPPSVLFDTVFITTYLIPLLLLSSSSTSRWSSSAPFSFCFFTVTLSTYHGKPQYSRSKLPARG